MENLFIARSLDKINFCHEHLHNCWEIVIPIFGTGCVKSKNQVLDFCVESLYIIPPNILHSNYSKNSFTDISIQVTDLPFDKDKITLIYPIKNLHAIAELIHVLFLKKDTVSINTIDTAIDFIIKVCLDIINEPYQNPLAKKIQNYLIENISNKSITMMSLSDYFQYDAGYLRKVYKKAYGVTPLSYLSNLRLSKAKDLLKSMPYYSISQVSELCGFESSLYFSRIFKKETSQTPRDYKSICKK